MSKTCFMIDATHADSFELFQFDVVTKAAGDLVDVFLITNKGPETGLPRHINLSDEVIFAPQNNVKNARYLIPGNVDLKILAAVGHPSLLDYSHFIRMEFDCVFSQDIGETIKELFDISQNYDVGYFSKFMQSPISSDWPWWSTFENWKFPDRVSEAVLYGTFLPLFLFNRKYIESYRAFLEDGWRAHQEVLVATVVEKEGFSDFKFAESENFNIDGKVFTVHEPRRFDSDTSKFFHPVKTYADFSKLPSRISKNYEVHGKDALLENLPFSTRSSLSQKDADFLKIKLRSAHRFLSFGHEGAVELACYAELQEVIFVTLQRDVALSVINHLPFRDFIALGHLQVKYMNIGKVNPMGAPVLPRRPYRWKRYFDLDWERLRPDLIFISGRFKVAVAASIYLNKHMDPETAVLFKDFWSRPHYSELLQIYEIVHDSKTLVELKFLPGKTREAEALLAKYEKDPK